MEVRRGVLRPCHRRGHQQGEENGSQRNKWLPHDLDNEWLRLDLPDESGNEATVKMIRGGFGQEPLKLPLGIKEFLNWNGRQQFEGMNDVVAFCVPLCGASPPVQSGDRAGAVRVPRRNRL
jgi:hypothetical protein